MWELKSKYYFTGIIELKTALHIGGGKVNVSNTDSPVVRTPDGLPFIPGSSFKGAFRSTIEKLAVSIKGITSCQLIENSTDCPTAHEEEFTQWKKNKKEDVLVNRLQNILCDTCKLFGSPYTASKIIFHDLMIHDDWAGVTQIRDGVVIDRDSERAKDQLKYDFEVVPPTSCFKMEIWLENPTINDLGLTCIGLNEFCSEMSYLGGIKSRGLGNCKITNLKIYKLDLESEGMEEKLTKYLLNTKPEDKMDQETEEHEDSLRFIQNQIEKFLKNLTLSKEVSDVKKISK